MSDIVGYIVIVFLIIGFSYGLICQWQETVYFIKSNKNKKEVLASIICTTSYIGFLMSYIFNVLVALQIIKSLIITSEATSFSCGIFLVILLISKYAFTTKKDL